MMKKLLAVGLVSLLGLGSADSAFALLSEGKVGPVTTSDGAINTLRQGRDGAAIVQDGHAKYQEQVVRGNTFYCANPAGTSVTTQAGLSLTTPALVLYNPINSGKNLVLLEASVEPTAAPAAAAGFMIAVSSAGAAGGPTVTTAGTIQNALLGAGSAVGVAQCYRVSTLTGAPVAVRYIGGTTGAAAIGGAVFNDPTDGKIIVSPGTSISIQATSAAAIIAHFLYEEVPL